MIVNNLLVNALLDFLSVLAERSSITDAVLDFYGLDEIDYVVGVDRESFRLAYIVYLTEGAKQRLSEKFGRYDEGVRKIISAFVKVVKSAISLATRLNMEARDDLTALLFSTIYRNLARKTPELRLPHLQLYVHSVLYLPFQDRAIPVMVMSMNVREELNVEPLPKDVYSRIVQAVEQALKSRKDVVEAYLFGNMANPRDVDITIVVNSWDEEEEKWRVIADFLNDVYRKFGDAATLKSRLDLFVYGVGEHDEFLEAARRVGIKLYSIGER